jgi:hypothetical protein
VSFPVARSGCRVYEVGIYAGRTYEEGKKIGWRDGFEAVRCIVRYSPLAERMRLQLRLRLEAVGAGSAPRPG